MFEKLKKMFKAPQPAGPPETLETFPITGKTITQDGVEQTAEGLRLSASGATTFRLFEYPISDVEQCMLTYRAQIRCEDLEGKGYLEMWCRLPGKSEFFSRGLAQRITGTCDWASYETPFYLKAGQKPDLLKLNVVTKGAGVIFIKDIEVLKTPLA